MRKILIIFFVLFLVGCNIISETPEDALKKLDSKEDSFKITKILNSNGTNEKQGFYVFESETKDGTEWFVANIVTNDLFWYVKEFINVGEPNNDDELYSSQANTFIAGISNVSEDKKDGRMIVPIPDNDYFVWIEILDN